MSDLKHRRQSQNSSAEYAAAASQGPSQDTDNSFMQSMLETGVDGLSYMGGLLNDNETAGDVQSAQSDLRSVAGFTNEAGKALLPNLAKFPIMGPLTSAMGLMNTSRAVNEGEEHGWNLERGFNAANGALTTIAPMLPGIGPLLAASYGVGTTAGKWLDRGSSAAAQANPGPEGDTRGISSRLADRGARVDEYVDDALTGVLSEENADLAGDVLGGAFTVGQMAVGGLHYDAIDSFTGGGATKAKDYVGESMSDAYDWATDW